MPSFFPHSRGAVFKVAGDGHQKPTPMSFAFEDQAIAFKSAIATSAGLSEQGNFQFTHTLNDSIYLYVFGNRISQLQISGVGFADFCNGPSNAKSGFADVVEQYRGARVSRGRPVSVAIGGARFKSFLTEMKAEIADAETMLTQWTFSFHTMPK